MTNMKRFQRLGFSMVELMVTIGMIAVLISILMPAIGRVRGQAKMATCASQLRQIYAAAVVWKAGDESRSLQAEGWRTTLQPIVQNLTIYNCPETKSADLVSGDVVTGDKAGTPGTPAQTSAAATPGAPNGVDLSNVFFHVNSTGWDAPLAEGPWVHKMNVTPTGYDLGFEDLGNTGYGDDWKDVVVHVEQVGPNSVTLTLLPLTKGMPGYTSSIEAKNSSGGVVDLMPSVYRSGGTQPGTSVPVNGTISGGSGSGASGSTSGTAAVAGSGTLSDYGINEKVRQIFGKPAKIFGMDYINSVIDPSVDNWSNAGWALSNGKPVFARHLGYANILFGDGSVRAIPLTSTNYNPSTGNNAATYFNP